MAKKPGFTTNADLPADVQEQYELTADLEGGPVFDLPNFRQTGIDFSKLTLDQANTLVLRKWPGIRRKPAPVPPPVPAAVPAIPDGRQAPGVPDATVKASPK